MASDPNSLGAILERFISSVPMVPAPTNNVPSNPRGYYILSNAGDAKDSLILWTAYNIVGPEAAPQIVQLGSGGTLQSPTAWVGGGIGAITSAGYVEGHGFMCATFIEHGGSGGMWNSVADIYGRIQLGVVVAGDISNRPGLTVKSASEYKAVLLTNNVDLRCYRIGYQSVYDGDNLENFERADAMWVGTSFKFGPAAAGTGVLRSMELTGAGIKFPISDPHVVGAYWDNGVTLVRSAG